MGQFLDRARLDQWRALARELLESEKIQHRINQVATALNEAKSLTGDQIDALIDGT